MTRSTSGIIPNHHSQFYYSSNGILCCWGWRNNINEIIIKILINNNNNNNNRMSFIHRLPFEMCWSAPTTSVIQRIRLPSKDRFDFYSEHIKTLNRIIMQISYAFSWICRSHCVFSLDRKAMPGKWFGIKVLTIPYWTQIESGWWRQMCWAWSTWNFLQSPAITIWR